MLGAGLSRLAGCYLEVSTVSGDVCVFGSVPGVLPGVRSLREAHRNASVELALSGPSPGEDLEAACSPPPWVCSTGEPAFVSSRQEAGLWLVSGLAQRPFHDCIILTVASFESVL